MFEDEKVVQATIEGQEMILKKRGEDVFYRPANEYGEWRSGIPQRNGVVRRPKRCLTMPRIDS